MGDDVTHRTHFLPELLSGHANGSPTSLLREGYSTIQNIYRDACEFHRTALATQ